MRRLFACPIYTKFKYQEFHDVVENYQWMDNKEDNIGAINRFTHWVVNFLLKEFRNTFYLTENKIGTNQFYHKYDWQKLASKELDNIKNKGKSFINHEQNFFFNFEYENVKNFC